MTLKFFSDISPQSRSGEPTGIHRSGYDGSQLEAIACCGVGVAIDTGVGIGVGIGVGVGMALGLGVGMALGLGVGLRLGWVDGVGAAELEAVRGISGVATN